MNIKRYKAFSRHAEDLPLKNRLRQEYVSNISLQSIGVDIILPTFNRSQLLVNAIRSIQSQLHRSWHLWICDDGSTDSTHSICKKYEHEARIKYLRLPHKGVSAARNSGLAQSSGEYISFLDSDNTWHPEYLSLMVAFLAKFKLDSAYCAARLIGDEKEQWLGDYFSWQACAEQNYIDLNCFMLKMPAKQIDFDEELERFVDWDFILTATKRSRTSYLPLPLVDYCNMISRDRITTTVYQDTCNDYTKLIREKHKSSMGQNENQDCRVTDQIIYAQQ